MPEILYPYAFDEWNKLVFIKDASQSQYHCVECGCEMIPRQGEINAWHFAHKSNNPSCSGESALHKITKLVLINRFNEKIFPKLIWNCQYCSKNHQWDIQAEKIDTEIIWEKIKPDLSFWNKAEMIAAVEIVVTHDVSKETSEVYIKNNIPAYIWRPTWETLKANRNHIVISQIINNVFHLECRDFTQDHHICFYNNPPYPGWMYENHCGGCPFNIGGHCNTRGGKQAIRRMEMENAHI